MVGCTNFSSAPSTSGLLGSGLRGRRTAHPTLVSSSRKSLRKVTSPSGMRPSKRWGSLLHTKTQCQRKLRPRPGSLSFSGMETTSWLKGVTPSQSPHTAETLSQTGASAGVRQAATRPSKPPNQSSKSKIIKYSSSNCPSRC